MNRVLLSGAAVLGIGCGAVLLGQPDVRAWVSRTGAPPGSNTGPYLVAEKTVHDFGSVPAGTRHQAVFPLRNTGTRRLILLEEGCACTDTIALPPIVPPRASGHVTIQFRAPDRPGAVRRKFTITTNDPHQPKLTLHVAAHVPSRSQSSEVGGQTERPPLQPTPDL